MTPYEKEIWGQLASIVLFAACAGLFFGLWQSNAWACLFMTIFVLVMQQKG